MQIPRACFLQQNTFFHMVTALTHRSGLTILLNKDVERQKKIKAIMTFFKEVKPSNLHPLIYKVVNVEVYVQFSYINRHMECTVI